MHFKHQILQHNRKNYIKTLYTLTQSTHELTQHGSWMTIAEDSLFIQRILPGD